MKAGLTLEQDRSLHLGLYGVLLRYAEINLLGGLTIKFGDPSSKVVILKGRSYGIVAAD